MWKGEGGRGTPKKPVGNLSFGGRGDMAHHHLGVHRLGTDQFSGYVKVKYEATTKISAKNGPKYISPIGFIRTFSTVFNDPHSRYLSGAFVLYSGRFSIGGTFLENNALTIH